MRRLIAAVVFSLLLVASARGVLVVAGPGLENAAGGAACTLWVPANATTQPVLIFDPSTFTYSGSNFSSGTNSGTNSGAWLIESGTPAKGTQLNGFDVISFTGAQSIYNATNPWPGGNVYVFTVAKVSATHIGALISAAWGTSDGRDATHDWVFYPRGGSAFGGSANEAWLFQGTSAGVITRGDLFTDTNYHIAAIKIGTSVDLRKDGTAGSPSSVTGAINTATSANIRVGASGISAFEALTGSVAYLAVLVDPTTADIQNFEGWAAWRFGLQANLPGGHPAKSAAPCAGGPAPGCTVSPCDPAPLTWTQIQSDNGTLATRQPIQASGYGTQHDTGVYPYGISFFSWELSGFEYLGDPLRPVDSGCPGQKHFDCTSMTAWHIVYPEAASYPFGVAKSSVAGVHVIYRNYQSWCHKVSGGWTLMQDPTTFSGGLVTNELTAKQDGVVQAQVTTFSNGEYSMLGPTVGNANHGWPNARGNFALHSVDNCYMQYEVRVDQPNANLLAGTGIDWWQNNGAPYPNNFEHSHGTWLRINQDWQRQTGTSMSLSALQADPPPPLVGIGP